MVNRVILIGNTGKEIKSKRLDNGSVVAKFSLATNENYKDRSGEWQTQTEWHQVIVWNKLAEKLIELFKSGKSMRIYLEGKITYRSYENEKGDKIYLTEIVASYTRKLDKNEQVNENHFPTQQEQAQKMSEEPEVDIDDDLPF